MFKPISSLKILFSFISGIIQQIFPEESLNQLNGISFDIGNERYTSLSTTLQWKNLSKIWKTMNSLDFNVDFKRSNAVFENLTNEIPIIRNTLMELRSRKLLTPVEEYFLRNLFERRIADSQIRLKVISNHKPSSRVNMSMIASQDLEKRYDILEKLAQDGKINSETFKTTKYKILEDLKAINKDDKSLMHNPIKSDHFDLIFLLSK